MHKEEGRNVLFNDALNTFIYGYMASNIWLRTILIVREETRRRHMGNSFNDALNTFYLRLYGVRHMVKDHSDSEKGNPLPPHQLLFFLLAARVILYAPPTDRITHTTPFVTPVVEHWLEREIWFKIHAF